MNKIDAIRAVDLLSPLSDIDKALLASEARIRNFERGETICTEGELGRTFYILGLGTLVVRRGKPPVDVATLKPGAYLGEMSLLTGAPRTATIIALERSELLELDRPVFLRLFSQNPPLAQLLSDQVARRRGRLEEVQGEVERLRLLQERESRDIFGRIRKVFGLGE
jgi:CRP-like cAMP-binding protein